VIGLVAGSALALAVPGQAANHAPVIPLWLVAPFALLLASIALMPFIHSRFWHRHYPDFAFVLGGLIAGYYLFAYRGTDAAHEASHDLLHAVIEYYAFIALVGGLFIVSGGILVDLRGRGTPPLNTLLLLAGSLLANLVGTTGASMLLIRPFMRVNRGRLRPLHIVLFILIVSNGGGSLTPIGDPPLYLGFLKGVPFFWTLEHLWQDWLLVVGLLLAVFYGYDAMVERRRQQTFSPLPTSEEAADLMEHQLRSDYGLRVSGASGLLFLTLMVAGVFVDPLLHRFAKIEGIPVGATLQVLIALAAYLTAPRAILAANDFNLGPVKEVGLLFLGIFITMVPALSYLGEHGHSFGINSPSAFYYGTGFLSAVLDNAPTYANFLQIALGPKPITPESLRAFLATPEGVIVLDAISTAAVFFGAMTYIGNGPNFMVKAIAESSGVAMPSFFGYLRWTLLILLPVLIIHWVVFIR
jgi:Na+/H+ antiporter NhaD/arsenite permease-like protein